MMTKYEDIDRRNNYALSLMNRAIGMTLFFEENII